MLTPIGVGFYSLKLVGVCRYLWNVDEVISPRFFMGPTLALASPLTPLPLGFAAFRAIAGKERARGTIKEREIEGGLETRNKFKH